MAEKKPGLLKRIFSFGFGKKQQVEEEQPALEAPAEEAVVEETAPPAEPKAETVEKPEVAEAKSVEPEPKEKTAKKAESKKSSEKEKEPAKKETSPEEKPAKKPAKQSAKKTKVEPKQEAPAKPTKKPKPKKAAPAEPVEAEIVEELEDEVIETEILQDEIDTNAAKLKPVTEEIIEDIAEEESVEGDFIEDFEAATAESVIDEIEEIKSQEEETRIEAEAYSADLDEDDFEDEIETPAPKPSSGEMTVTLTERKQVAEPEPEPEPEEERKKGWLNRLTKGLSRSSNALTENITKVFSDKKLDDDTLQDLEDILIQADLGIETAMKITDALAAQKFGKSVTDQEVREIMAEEIEKILSPVAKDLDLDLEHQPHVILMIGVNGSGKTTTIGKLSQKLYDAGFSTSLIAGDTFRAAAIEQLKIWGERTQSPVLSRPLGADAAGLAYDAWEMTKEERRDVMLMDTAGRLQNRTELMDELEKIVRVLKKQDPEAPHTVLLTLDATTGQNALNQVEIFKEVAGVNGIVMTKLDGTARGGIMVAIAAKYKLPVYFIGVGEQVEDLEPFEARDFARSIAGLPREEETDG